MQKVLKKTVLLLNASYEPIGLIPMEKAICLKFKDKVHYEEVIEGVQIRSPKSSWDVPSVVRLKYYKNITSNKIESSKKRQRIYIRDGRRCSYCSIKCSPNNITLDHVIPKAQGGENSPQNLVTCCLSCNTKKGNKTPEQANMKLLHTPVKLKVGLDKHVLMHYGNMNPVWKKYLFHGEDSNSDNRYSFTE